MTHAHADHLHGIDDIRRLNRLMRAAIPLRADGETLAETRRRFGYALAPPCAPGRFYKPALEPNEITAPLRIGGVGVTPFVRAGQHGTSDRIGNARRQQQSSEGRLLPSEAAGIHPGRGLPGVITGQVDVLPADRREMGAERIAKAAAAPNPHRRPNAHRFPARSFFGGFRTPAPYPGRLLAPDRYPRPFKIPALRAAFIKTQV
jgi:Beta-lactamase superfamily domain